MTSEYYKYTDIVHIGYPVDPCIDPRVERLQPRSAMKQTATPEAVKQILLKNVSFELGEE